MIIICLLGSLSFQSTVSLSTEKFIPSKVVTYLTFVQQAAAAQTNSQNRFIYLGLLSSQPLHIQRQADITGNFSVYENHPYGFRLEYPSNWILHNDTQLGENNRAHALFYSAQTGSVFSIDVSPSPAASSLQLFTANWTEYLHNNGLFPTGPNSTSVDGIPANEIFFYTGSGLGPGPSNGLFATDEVVLVNNGNAYIFRYTTSDISKYTTELHVIKEVINSFQPIYQHINRFS